MREKRHSSYIRYNTRATSRALNIAVIKGHFETVEQLLSKGAEVNLSCESLLFKGFTPLCSAVIAGNEEITKLLLSKGAHANFPLDDGRTPLHLAIVAGHAQIVGYLLTHGAHVNSAYYRRKNLMEFKPLIVAVLCGFEEITKILLSRGADANCTQDDDDDITPLHIAVRQGHIQILEHLLNHGAIVTCSCTRSPLKSGFVPLAAAVQKGNAEITNLLLSRGAAHVNCTQNFGLTPLHFAAHNGHFEIVEELLSRGADVNSVCTNSHLMGFTPLHFAAVEGHEDVVKLLLVYRANVNAKLGGRFAGWTALEVADCRGFTKDKTLFTYQEEVELMKKEKIGNSNIFFCDILTVSKNQLATYAMNVDIGLILKSNDCKMKFPLYASMLNSRFRKAIERRKLMKQCSNLFYSLLGNLCELPQNCIEKILSYLSDKHLRILADACNTFCSP